MATETLETSGTAHQLAGKHLTFILGREHYGLPVLKVREIIRLCEITPVSQMPDSIKGGLNLRGKTIPVADLRVKFRLSKIENTDLTWIVVVQVSRPDHTKTMMGLIVDAVEETNASLEENAGSATVLNAQAASLVQAVQSLQVVASGEAAASNATPAAASAPQTRHEDFGAGFARHRQTSPAKAKTRATNQFQKFRPPTTRSKMNRPTMTRTLILTALAVGTATLAHAGDGKAAAPDKSRYTLFNPTPAAQMRELSTDRPDKTESAFTVDAGHFQIEMDLLTYERDHDTAGGANTLTESWGIAPINLKVGLCNRTDLQVVLDTYGSVRTRDRVGRTTTKQHGFGDITTRLKVNLWGNDGGTTAFAAMPFVKFPTSQDGLGNRAVEWGLILPLAVDLGGGFGLGLMTEVNFLQNEENRRYHTEFVNSITVSHDLVGNLGGYVEFWSVVSTETDSKWQGTVDVGLTYGVTDNIQLDAGINFGVTKSAPDLQPFLGLSVRF